MKLLISLTLTVGACFAQIGGDGVWIRNAVLAETPTFDECNAHQPGTGEYHYHDNPVCLRLQLNDNIEKTSGRYREKTGAWAHSPILGWAFDGYPIYGPYGYSDPTNPGSAIKRISSSFRIRNITLRRTLPDWAAAVHGIPAQLTEAQYGPDVSDKYPLGWYVEDFELATGDLDVYNGRFTVTPEFPAGTYAYYVTVNDDGSAAFPYVLGRQYYGVFNAGRVPALTETVKDYFANSALAEPASSDPYLSSWLTKYSSQRAQIVDAAALAAGPQTTWNGQSTAVNADIQRIRYSDNWVYVNASGLASHIMGPWYNPIAASGLFPNFPHDQQSLNRFNRHPNAANTKTTNQLGSLGMWVNGVAVFNMLDGASWTNASKSDQMGGGGPGAGGPPAGAPPAGGPPPGGAPAGGAGGGPATGDFDVTSAATAQASALAPAAIASLWGYNLAASTATAESASWPTTLGGAQVSVTDSRGTSRPAELFYASPQQVKLVVPSDSAPGLATITVSSANRSQKSAATIASVAPRLFTANSGGLASANILRVKPDGTQSAEAALAPVNLGPDGDQVFLTLYGTGLRGVSSMTAVRATIGGIDTPVLFAGANAEAPGLDQVNLQIPRSLAGSGIVDVFLLVDGRKTNIVNLTIQ